MSRVPSSAINQLFLFLSCRKTDDVFGQSVMDPLCKFCYAKKFKMSAIKITEIVTIAPEVSIGL